MARAAKKRRAYLVLSEGDRGGGADREERYWPPDLLWKRKAQLSKTRVRFGKEARGHVRVKAEDGLQAAKVPPVCIRPVVGQDHLL